MATTGERDCTSRARSSGAWQRWRWAPRLRTNYCERTMTERFRGERTLMRVFIGESDKYHGKPLYEVLLERFRKKGMAGATVLRGVAGFGASSTAIHTEKVLRL